MIGVAVNLILNLMILFIEIIMELNMMEIKYGKIGNIVKEN